MPQYENASRDEYEQTFNAIEVALKDMDAYEQWEQTFETAKQQTLEDEAIDDDVQAGFAQMLTRLYAEAADLQNEYMDKQDNDEREADRKREKGKDADKEAAKLRAYQKGNTANAYRHDADALLDGMQMLGTLSEKVSAAELEEEAQRQYDSAIQDKDTRDRGKEQSETAH